MGRFRQVFADFGELTRLDALMLRAEIRENFGRLARGAVLGVLAVIALVLAVAFLNVAAFIGLGMAGVPRLYAALAMGGVYLLIAIGLCVWAIASFGAVSVTPKRTLKQVSDNLSALKAGLTHASHQSS